MELSRLRRRAVLGAAAALSAGLTFWIALLLAQQNHQLLADLGGVATVLALLVTVLAWLVDRLLPAAGEVEEARGRLALAVVRQWHDEAIVRRLLDSDPLPVEWRVIQSDGADALSAGQLFGRTDDSAGVDEMAGRLLAWRRRRLVILGPPGAGKTSLAVLLTLALARRCRTDPTYPVPLLLSAGTWDSVRETLVGWLQRRLSEDYGLVPASALDLVTSGRLLPILDGFDELPEDRIRAALRAFNSQLIADDPLVVLSRGDEYLAATRSTRALAAATVVEALPVRPADAISFLERALPLADAGRWRQVLAQIELDPRCPLASVLASPLMVSLVRQIHGPADGDLPADPGPLLDFPDQAALEEHLLTEAVPAAFRRAPSLPGRWRAEQARHWLTFLARHLHALRTRDLAWWELQRGVPIPARMAVAGLAGLAVGWAITIGPLLSVALDLPHDILMAVVAVAVIFVVGAAAMTLIGAAIGLLVGFLLGPVAWVRSRVLSAAAAPVSTVPPSAAPVDWLVLGLILGLAFAAALVPLELPRPTTLLSTFAGEILLLGGTFTVAGVLADALWRGLESRLRTNGRMPATTLRQDRAGTIITAIVVELAMFDFVVLTPPTLVGSDVPTLATIFSVFAVAAALTHPWPDYVLARCWLAITGQLPLRLETFLRAAHQRGVLSQVGSYRFRQPSLRDILASKG